jgi:hypothetical protein
MACEAKSLDQNDARFTSSRQGFGSGRALSVIVQPVFEFHHPLLKTIKVLPDVMDLVSLRFADGPTCPRFSQSPAAFVESSRGYPTAPSQHLSVHTVIKLPDLDQGGGWPRSVDKLLA